MIQNVDKKKHNIKLLFLFNMDIKHNIKRWTGERKKKIEDIFGKQNHMKLMWLLRLNSHIRMRFRWNNRLSSTWVSEGCKPEHLDKESKGMITILLGTPSSKSFNS